MNTLTEISASMKERKNLLERIRELEALNAKLVRALVDARERHTASLLCGLDMLEQLKDQNAILPDEVDDFHDRAIQALSGEEYYE